MYWITFICRHPLTHHIWHISSTSEWFPTSWWLDDNFVTPSNWCCRVWWCG